MVHVCFVSFDMPWTLQGGVETHVDRLATALVEEGDEVTVVTRRPPDDDRPYAVRTAPTLEPLEGLVGPHWRYRLLAEARFARDATDVADGLGADIVHFQDYAGRPDRTSAPTVATIHIPLEAQYEEARRRLGDGALSGLRRWLQDRHHARRLARARGYLPALDALVTVNEIFAGTLSEAYEVDVEVIPNGVDPVPAVDPETARDRLELPVDATVVLFLGRLSEAKDPLSLLEIDRPGTLLVYAGTGALADRVRAAADRRDDVRYLGYVSESTKHDLLAAADLFALPSRSEGQPIAILEALAHGTPVHTTREEWVPEGLRGYCTFGSLDDALDEALRIEVPRDRVPDWSDVADRFRGVYERVLASAGPKDP